MPTWIRNIPETWANTDGWRTDIALTTLCSTNFDTAEFHLGDGTRIRVPMAEMRRALRSANVRTNRMVGPFNVNPHEQTVNGERVKMEVLGEAHQEPPREVPQIPTSITPDLLTEDGSFIPFGSFCVRYRRPVLSDDDLRKAHRALQNLYHQTRTQPAKSEEFQHGVGWPERINKPLVLDIGHQDVPASDSQVLPRKRAALLQKSPAIVALWVVLLLVIIVFLILRYFR